MLRETGALAEAAQLQSGPLAEMIVALRTSADTDEALAARLESILAAESERVADAVVLAELLAPLLQHRASPQSIPPPAAPAPMPTKQIAPARAVPTDIADFIDEMIAQENAPSDGGRRPQRRAS